VIFFSVITQDTRSPPVPPVSYFVKLASIEIVKELQAHPNADRLELAKVSGWQCVVKKGEFMQGQQVLFVTIDTVLPRASWSEFLADKVDKGKQIRLKTVKLRGEYSQGLVLPVSILEERGIDTTRLKIGDDVSESMGVRKYEKEVPAGLTGIALGPFPSHICAATDEENGLGDEELVKEVLARRTTVTRKLDGSSCTVVVNNGIITHVCSRRLVLQETEESGFWKVARQLELGKIGEGRIVIQGELMGPKVQGNQLRLKSAELHVFQIQVNGEFLSHQEMREFCEKKLKCPAVPLLGHFGPEMSLEEFQAFADEQRLDNGEPAEGIVIRPCDYPKAGSGRPLGFKLINRNYRD